MSEFFLEYGIFLAKSLTIVIALLASVGGIVAIATKGKRAKGKLEIIKLNKSYEEARELLNRESLDKKALKALAKSEKRRLAAKEKESATPVVQPKRLFVFDFEGDLKASAVSSLREAITSILTVVTPQDEVLINVESTGGTIHGYGLAASQLMRIKARQIPLIVSVDKVAASGGYMMACVADRILAAPFAVIGSIGVIAQLPNFHRLLKKCDIDFEQITAGEYKRTLSLFGENTAAGREKLQQEINEAHMLFKGFVAQHRTSVEIEKLATGETWYGLKAQELGLVDEVLTSDDYLLRASERGSTILKVRYQIKKGLVERVMGSVEKTVQSLANL